MNISVSHIAIKIYLLIFSSVLLYSCSTITEDFSNCKELDLKFKYHIDKFGFAEIDFIESVDSVYLYIFDEQLEFLTFITLSTSQIADNTFKVTVPISYIGNTMIAVAREMLGSYDVPMMKVGDHIDLLTLKLKIDDSFVNSTKLADLFHGGKVVMDFADDGGTTQIIHFKSTSKQIKLKLFDTDGTNLSYLYDVKLTARNGYYLCDNSFMPNSPMITYMPWNQLRDSRSVDSFLDIRTLRMKERYKDDVLLTIVDRNTGAPVEFSKVPYLKLIDYLLDAGIPRGMTNQEYLDAEHLWELSISIMKNSNLAVSITVDDWTMWFDNTEL